RFPALRLRPGHELPTDAQREIRIVGSTTYVWQSVSAVEMLIVSTAKNVDDRELHVAMFDPMLLYLALLANDERNADGLSPQRWFIEREFILHLAHAQGIRTWHYPRDVITPGEAMHYLVELTQDFLDAGQF